MSDQQTILQKHPRKIGAGALAAAVAIAVPFIKPQEGHGAVGYRDIVGVPTYCYGGTGPQVVVGRHYTDVQCQSQIAQDVAIKAQMITQCITVDVPPPSLAAFISFSYNVGASGFCRSNVARDLNAGRLRAACADLSAWVYAGGKRLQGLVNRRAAERALCEHGAPA